MKPKSFIGEKEILGIVDTGRKTPIGSKIIKVQFEDGTTADYTEKTYNRVRQAEKVDATTLRKLRCEPLVQEILALMVESNLRWDEVDYVLGLTAESLNANSETASNVLWKVESPGERTLLDVDRILRNKNESK